MPARAARDAIVLLQQGHVAAAEALLAAHAPGSPALALMRTGVLDPAECAACRACPASDLCPLSEPYSRYGVPAGPCAGPWPVSWPAAVPDAPASLTGPEWPISAPSEPLDHA